MSRALAPHRARAQNHSRKEAKAKFDKVNGGTVRRRKHSLRHQDHGHLEYERFDAEVWKGAGTMGGAFRYSKKSRRCASRPAYKKVLAEETQSRSVHVLGRPAKRQKDSSTVWTKKNMSLKDGTLCSTWTKSKRTSMSQRRKRSKAALN